MKKISTILPGFIVVLFSCTTHNVETQNIEKEKNTFSLPKKVVLADLPDSLQPKTISLDDMPKPEMKVVPKDGGITKMLPVLKDNQGEPIFDQNHKYFFLGDGGRSYFTNLTSDQGLALDAVVSSAIDKKGNLWFGTFGGGVSRYDGNTFTTFTTDQGLAGNRVWCIAEDRNNNLWFGTWGGGVSRYDGNTFTNFTTEQGLSGNIIWSIEVDRNGNLWFGTDDGGVSYYDGNTFTTYDTEKGLAGNRVWSILEDRQGNLWFGTDGDGVSEYNGNTFTTYTTKDGLAENEVRSIVEDQYGNIWFGTFGGGVSRFDGNMFTTFTMKDGLANDVVRCIAEDLDGNIWFGTFGGGVSRYDGESFTTYTDMQGLANNIVRSITVDKIGNLWFGTWGGGVSRFEGNGFVNFTSELGLVNNIVWSIEEDKKGNLWVGTEGGGISRFDGYSFTNFTSEHGLSNNIVWDIKEDKTGNLWFATFGGGVSCFDGNTFTNYTIEQGLANNIVWSISEDYDGNLWFGTFGGGVSRFDGNSFTTYTTEQGLTNNLVRSIIQDSKGHLWFATARGGVNRLLNTELEKINKMTDGSNSLKFEHFTVAQGLANDIVNDIVEDKDGNIIIGTNSGFTLIPAKVSALPFSEVKNHLEYYNNSTGYPLKAINPSAMFCARDGGIWAGTASNTAGLVKFNYSKISHKTVRPLPFIQSIKIKDESICWFNLLNERKRYTTKDSITALLHEFLAYGRKLTDSENAKIFDRFGNIKFDSITDIFPIPENLVLPYEHNHITFDFVGIETSKPSQVRYQFFMDGYSDDWSPVTRQTSASFGNMREGTYTFRLKVMGADGIWTKPITYNFEVLPPWFRTRLAYFLYLFIVGISIYGFIRWRTVSLKKENERLENKVNKRTVELKNSFDHLKATQAQLIQSEKMASLGELTAGIAHEIQNPLNFVNNFSEVNNELIDELNDELVKGDIEEAKAISKDIKENGQKINHHGKRAEAIVKGMLQHSRTSSGVKEPTDINALADEYLRLSYHGLRAKDKSFNAEFKTEFDESLPKINIIPQDIGRVLLNLINNAFYAVQAPPPPEGGIRNDQIEYRPTVIVKTSYLPPSGGPRGAVEIRVSDNGPGIPASIIDKIFQPFFTTKPTGSGTGLGLSLSYDIVKAHGGSLSVKSKENYGTEFIIQIPNN